ncbi:MAG: two-component regulator propeller domain-containing protein [Crocinitomicaceae bacterium]
MLQHKTTYLLAFALMLFAWICNANSTAQTLKFKNYTALDGLSSSEVYDITQDDQGYLWFATDRGLSRFDGRNFSTFTVSDGITDNVVFNFFEHNDGTIWCSTLSNRVFSFKNESEGFIPYKYNDSLQKYAGDFNPNSLEVIEGKLYANFHGLYGYLRIDEQGNVYSTLRNSSDFRRSLKTIPGSNHFIYCESEENAGFDGIRMILSSKLRTSISRKIKLTKGRTVFIFGSQCFISSSNAKKFDKYEVENSDAIIMAGKFNDEHFWIGYQNDGTRIFSAEGKVVNHFLKDYSVSSVYSDHEGGIWISTLNNGVFYCAQTSIDYFESLGSIKDLAEDHSGGVYCATVSGKIYHFSGNEWKVYAESPDLPLTAITQGEEEDVFFYGGARGSLIEQGGRPRLLSNQQRLKSFSDNLEGARLAVVGISSIVKLSKDSVEFILKAPSIVYDVEEYSDGYLIATRAGLYQYSNEQLTFLGDKFPELKGRIQDVDVFEGLVYLATMGKGVIIFNGNSTHQIVEEQGLISNTCTEIFVESEGTFWVGTSNGMCKISRVRTDFHVTPLSIDQGVPFSEVTDLHKIGNDIWISAKEGLFRIDEKEFDQISHPMNKWLHFRYVNVNDSSVLDGKDTCFDHTQNEWKFSFDAIAFSSKGGRFRYRLKGNNASWVYSDEGYCRYSDLNPGDYEFIVQVKLENDSWGEEIRYRFSIAPPIWKTWWFILSIIALIILIIYLAFRYDLLAVNKKMIREFFRLLMRKLRSDERLFVVVRSSRSQIRIATNDILYFNSSGNYYEVKTIDDRHVCRGKISEFYDLLPDKGEFVRLHRSYYVRIEHVTRVSSKSVFVGRDEIPVSKTYSENLDRIQLD